MITLQLSFIDRNTAETWTITRELETLDDMTDYLMGHPPENVAVKDTFLVDVKVEEGVNLYFRGWQGGWELTNQSDYQHTWQYEYKQAMETKALRDKLKAEGKIHQWTAETPEAQAKLDKLRQDAQDAPRRRKERYEVS